MVMVWLTSVQCMSPWPWAMVVSLPGSHNSSLIYLDTQRHYVGYTYNTVCHVIIQREKECYNTGSREREFRPTC